MCKCFSELNENGTKRNVLLLYVPCYNIGKNKNILRGVYSSWDPPLLWGGGMD